MCRTRLRFSFRFLQALPLVLPLAMGAASVAAGPSPMETAKLEPRLLQAAESAPEDTVSAWVEFTDKGELSPFDLAQRLAATEAGLTPRARARRLRAHVHPLVDYLDLPVEPSYLDALRGRGFRPYGASRWFNRVAVRAPARDVSRLADLTFVRQLTSVEVMQRTSEPESVGVLAQPPRRPAGASAV